MSLKAVFLDRDGTVIVDPPDERVDKVDKIKLFPDTLSALEILSTLEYKVFLITNQAGISEKRMNESEFKTINNHVLDMISASGINILKTYMCPHGPNDRCECRKPKPTMILQAAEEFDIDLTNSWMIGDRQSDILAGKNAGTKTILVKTANTPVFSDEADYTVPSLLDAIEFIARK